MVKCGCVHSCVSKDALDVDVFCACLLKSCACVFAPPTRVDYILDLKLNPRFEDEL